MTGTSASLVLRRADAKLGVYLLGHALGEVGSGNLVDGNNDHAAQQASEEDDHPLGAVLAPDEDFVAFGDLARVQLARETMRVGQHIAVRPALRAIAAMMDVGDLAGMPLEVVEILQDGGACHQESV